MAIDKINNLEECRQYVRQKVEVLRPLFAKAIIGDFSGDVPSSDEDDEFTELYTGIQTIMEVIRGKISDLEIEIGQRHDVEQRLIDRNYELAQNHKAIMNVMDDLQKTKSDVEQEEAKYEALINSVGDGIMATGNKGDIIFINTTAEEMLGWRADEVIGKKLDTFLEVEDEKGNSVPLEKRGLLRVINTGKAISVSNHYYFRRNRTKFPVSLTASPILLGTKAVGAVAVFRDITREKELDRAKSEFISVASHQLRTPVTAMRWLNEMSQSALTKLTPKEKSRFKDLSSSIERLSKLVEDLLNVSRIELGTVKEEKIAIDLPQFVQDFLSDLGAYAESKNHKIIFNNEIGSVTVSMDSKMLYNVMQNLVSNAIDYSPPGTKVTVILSQDSTDAKVSIANEGPTIPPDEQKKLFGKFYRGESTSKMKTEGTGLGLYIVKSNIESAGGKVGFFSKKGENTVFWFTLPTVK